MKNSLRIHKWTHNEFNIFILGVLTRPLFCCLHENIYHIFHFQRSALRIKGIRAGRCRLYLPGFERIFHQIIGGYSILAIPTLSPDLRV